MKNSKQYPTFEVTTMKQLIALFKKYSECYFRVNENPHSAFVEVSVTWDDTFHAQTKTLNNIVYL